MTGILVVVAAFIIALIGIFRNNRPKSGERRVLGLNLIGVLLLVLSSIAVAASIAKELQSIRSSRAAKEREALTDSRLALLPQIAVELRDAAKRIPDPLVRRQIVGIGDQVSGIAGNHAFAEQMGAEVKQSMTESLNTILGKAPASPKPGAPPR